MVIIIKEFQYILAHVPGVENELADALSRSPVALPSTDIALLNINDFDSSSSTPYRFGSMRVGMRNQSACVFSRTVTTRFRDIKGYNEVRQLGYEWPRISRDITAWVSECPHCQKIRGKADVTAVPSPIGSLCIFEEL